MSWNANNFCRSAEAGLTGMFATAGASAAAARRQAQTDASGWRAVSRLATALRRERRRSAALEAELISVYRRLETAETALSLRRPR
ncbi:hypothetical protein NPA31_018860 [Aurantimonas sp. MSK8Z-1]|uniref:hypothetical protein n=1 Tax=Mangrovibrevibacter kandeliae TaxID=2968473 RepID=UPI0021173D64|nr:hypothetical protein [Aurantimonas sp. MSK8Z-1]MCW4117025.1 hypothetical protein [Aurantimonas sp. MSK8Z-1]